MLGISDTGCGAEVQRCRTLQTPSVSLGTWRGADHLYPRCPNICCINCATENPCLSGVPGPSASFPFLLYHYSSHTLLFLEGPKSLNGLFGLTYRGLTPGLPDHSLPRQGDPPGCCLGQKTGHKWVMEVWWREIT